MTHWGWMGSEDDRSANALARTSVRATARDGPKNGPQNDDRPVRMNGVAHLTATCVRMLSERDREWDARMTMIENAQRFLILTTYYFDCDARSGALAEALIAAARRGVRVVLVLDRFGQRLGERMNPPADRARLAQRFRRLVDAGGCIVRYRPVSRRQRIFGGGLHVKIQVSEVGAAIFGSSNIAFHSFFQWNEVSLQIEGALAAHLLRDACRYANLSAQDTASLEAMLPPPDTDAPSLPWRYLEDTPEAAMSRWFPFGAVRNRLTAELIAMIDGARASLLLTSFYYKPAPDLRDAVLRACARGVRVEIFHSHRDALEASALPWLSTTFHFDALLRVGGCLYENTRGEHSKIVLVDGRTVAVGSYNFEHAAHDRLIEAMLFSDDTETCDAYARWFDALRNDPGNSMLRSSWANDLPIATRALRWCYRPLQRWI
ncbi:MAG: phosphatidylserine/phosphatidylglycerophosphate/cardiolipin synthase family protein [Xanthomonadaceae bacterium]|nr:phosphatidylserine/phosphatidylglycerophosphate/cardiolipin synthase family protein [Xanthomonadaceae bacterium]